MATEGISLSGIESNEDPDWQRMRRYRDEADFLLLQQADAALDDLWHSCMNDPDWTESEAGRVCKGAALELIEDRQEQVQG